MLCACSSEYDADGNHYDTTYGPLEAWCDAKVKGVGNVPVEGEYLAGVVRCENGGAPLEALKAQAVAARSYLYYKMNTSGSIADGTSDQVYSCGKPPKDIHYQAVEETAGVVLRYKNTQVAAFYVAGSVPSTASCVAKAGDNDYSNTEKYVTYNQGKSGDGLTQTTLGWVNAGNHANRGCKSQNGAACLAKKGWGYKQILKFYYGEDIQIVTATGPCVNPPGGTDTSGSTDQGTDTGAGTDTGGETTGGETTGGETTGGETTGGETTGETTGEEPPPCVCEAGNVLESLCGTCGLQQQVCGSDCQWGTPSACNPVTETTPCAGADGPGVWTCIGGTLECRDEAVVEPEEPGYPYAAETVDLSVPIALVAAQAGTVVVVFRNVGTQPWPAGAMGLKRKPAVEASALEHEDWDSPEFPRYITVDVAVGETAAVSFPIRMPADVTATVVEAAFVLTHVDLGPLVGPSPVVSMSIPLATRSGPGARQTINPTGGSDVTPQGLVDSSTGCQVGQNGQPSNALMPLFLLFGVLLVRRRWFKQSPHHA